MTIAPEDMIRTTTCAVLDKKAQNVSILDVRGLVSYTDFFIVCSGESERQVRAIAEQALMTLKREGLLPLGVEGLQESQWVLLDYGDVVVHIFYGPIRRFYDLDGLWADAPRIPVQECRSGE